MQSRTGSVSSLVLTAAPLMCIVAIGIILRTARLTTVPPSLSHDETAIAYNAYSILQTGKDEYGEPFPVLFRSFDDYKLPGMVYSTVPWVALFGKSEAAARIPSALFGVLAIPVVFLIAVELLGRHRYTDVGAVRLDGALLPPFLVAIQPWHINFSRQLFESNGAVFWFLTGTYFLLASRKKFSLLLWSGLSYAVALYFYYSVRLVIPFMVLAYGIGQWKAIRSNLRTALLIGIVCFAASLPILRAMASPGGLERISMVSVANDPEYHKRRDAYIRIMGDQPGIVQKIIYNRRVALVQTIVENYGKNISPRNLFVSGTGTYGALFPVEIVLVPLGFLMLMKLPAFGSIIVCLWAFSAFLPGAFSVNQPNTLRTLVAAPVFAVLSGLGILYATSFTRRIHTSAPLVTFILIFLIIAAAFPKFLYAYFTDNPLNNSIAFGDGHKQMVQYVTKHENDYDRIVISGHYWRPYIFLLYWDNTDPSAYQTNGSRDGWGKYVFTAAPWDTGGTKLSDPAVDITQLGSENGKTLYILTPNEFEVHQKSLKKISDIDGKHAAGVFVAAERSD